MKMASSEASETKTLITSILTSNPLKMTIKQLRKDFLELVGYDIPFRELGYKSIEDYLHSIPDTVRVHGSGMFAEVQGVVKPKSAHINEMVAKQRKTSIPKHMRRHIKPFQELSQPSVSNNQRLTRPVINSAKKRYTNPPREQSFDPASHSHQENQPSTLNSQCCSRPKDETYNNWQNSLSDEETEVDRSNTTSNSQYCPIPKSETHNNYQNSYSYQETKVDSGNNWNNGCMSQSLENNSTNRPHSWQYKELENSKFAEKERDDYSDTSTDYDDFETDVPRTIQNNLTKLISRFPNGIACVKLPEEYRKMFNKKLDYVSYNYRSLIEMCADLPEIFHYVQPTPDEFILYDKHKLIPSLNQNEIRTVNDSKNERIKGSVFNEMFDWFTSLTLIPDDVLHLSDRIPRYFPDEDVKVGEYLDICMGEIYDISKFWVYKMYGELTSLMKDLQAFFEKEKNKYLIPEALLEEGLYCTVFYKDEYHRAVIVNLQTCVSGCVKVLFIDYGTLGNVPRNEIWYLPKQFGNVPCQAIKARLSNVCPCYKERKWTVQAINRFKQMVTNVVLLAEIIKIDLEDHVLEIYLADTTDQDHIFFINDKLVKEGHALHPNQVQN